MVDLEYKIGRIETEPDYLNCRSDPYDAMHKFIVERHESERKIYIGIARSHRNLAEQCGVNTLDVIGGGSCYIDSETSLVLGDASAGYGAIPMHAAKKFLALVAEEFGRRKIPFKKTLANPKEECVRKEFSHHF